MNVAQPPFDNKALRQAVAWALDRDEIRRSPTSAPARPAPRRCRPARPWYDGADPYAAGPNLDKAKAAAGSRRATANGLTIDYLGLPQYPELLKTGEVVAASSSKQIGITHEHQAGRRLGLVRPLHQGQLRDHLAPTRSARSTPTTSTRSCSRPVRSINATEYANPAVDKLIDQAPPRPTRRSARRSTAQLRADRLRRRPADLRPLRDAQLSDAQERRRVDDQPDARAATGGRLDVVTSREAGARVARYPRPNIAPQQNSSAAPPARRDRSPSAPTS